MNPGTILHTSARQQIRKQLLWQRQQLTPTECEDYSQRISTALHRSFPELLHQRVAFYWPIRNEPDLTPLMREWSVQHPPGFAALLPVIQGRQAPLCFRRWTPTGRMSTDDYGIPYPAEGELEIPQALIIPCVACDHAGYRLGYGGGYYDRTLAVLPSNILCIGVGYAFAVIDSIFPQAHDMKLDAWVSEIETRRIK